MTADIQRRKSLKWSYVEKLILVLRLSVICISVSISIILNAITLNSSGTKVKEAEAILVVELILNFGHYITAINLSLSL